MAVWPGHLARGFCGASVLICRMAVGAASLEFLQGQCASGNELAARAAVPERNRDDEGACSYAGISSKKSTPPLRSQSQRQSAGDQPVSRH